MPWFETFSKRRRRQQGTAPDVFKYDELPKELRVQIVYILQRAFLDPFDRSHEHMAWGQVHQTVAKEYGRFTLATKQLSEHSLQSDCIDCLLNSKEFDVVIDLVEYAFVVVDTYVGGNPMWKRDEANAAIDELNHRFREHAIGYQFVKGQLLRQDSVFLHDQVVLPTLSLLGAKEFRGAEDEFLTGHEHYRAGRTKEAVVEALKALESTIKTIAALRRWKVDSNASANQLIQTLFDREFVPTALQSEFGALRSLLESGLPTVRNRTSGHGQGPEPTALPRPLAAFALHMAAANIVYLVETHDSTPQ